jgi:hypothetical protein
VFAVNVHRFKGSVFKGSGMRMEEFGVHPSSRKEK